MDIFRAKVGAVFLYKDSKLSLEAFNTSVGKTLKNGCMHSEIDLEDNIVGYAARKGKIIFSDGLHYKSKKYKIPEMLVTSNELNSFICLPLKSKSKVVGILFMGDCEFTQFQNKGEELLKSFGNTIGVSIENASLFEEIKAKNLEIEQERKKLKYLTNKLIISQEEERSKIARELHDEAGQLMSALKINLEMIERNVPRDLMVILDLIKKSTNLVDKLSCEIKRLCANLHPSVLDSLGLIAAISSCINDFQKSYSVNTEFNYSKMRKRLPCEIERIIYRVVQESLNNIAKHAQASKVVVNFLDTPKNIIVTIEDNGKGFDVKRIMSSSEANRGLGLLGIKERVSLVNGRVIIKSKIGKGTIIRLEVPKHL